MVGLLESNLSCSGFMQIIYIARFIQDHQAIFAPATLLDQPFLVTFLIIEVFSSLS